MWKRKVGVSSHSEKGSLALVVECGSMIIY